jgi:hypothetical protein
LTFSWASRKQNNSLLWKLIFRPRCKNEPSFSFCLVGSLFSLNSFNWICVPSRGSCSLTVGGGSFTGFQPDFPLDWLTLFCVINQKIDHWLLLPVSGMTSRKCCNLEQEGITRNAWEIEKDLGSGRGVALSGGRARTCRRFGLMTRIGVTPAFLPCASCWVSVNRDLTDYSLAAVRFFA